ncbi:hypothetical protein [Microbacterium sp. A94]|uniref:hypothetical protein n=1 Tax=Microbacterium sp. A94 TaxID=3450717 RepID=UPI003F41D5FD
MRTEDDFSPDPRKITVRGGVIFNPWVNITASVIITAGLGWLTVWFWGLWREVIDAPAYEDQGLDIAGVLIGVVFAGLATIALFVVTIWLVVWWAKRSGKNRRV